MRGGPSRSCGCCCATDGHHISSGVGVVLPVAERLHRRARHAALLAQVVAHRAHRPRLAAAPRAPAPVRERRGRAARRRARSSCREGGRRARASAARRRRRSRPAGARRRRPPPRAPWRGGRPAASRGSPAAPAGRSRRRPAATSRRRRCARASACAARRSRPRSPGLARIAHAEARPWSPCRKKSTSICARAGSYARTV